MDEPIPISALGQYAFCPRRCALMFVEGQWADNEHTLLGSIAHENVNERGYETLRGVRLLRSLPLYSRRYGLSGKADIVEVHAEEIIPVEFKKGPRRRFENDDVQLCAQALCLEEMFATSIIRGFIYHAASRRRREVSLDGALRSRTADIIREVRELLDLGLVPQAVLLPRCNGCSLRKICVPEVSDPNYYQTLEIAPLL